MRIILFLCLIVSLKFANACLILFYSDGEKVFIGNHEDWFTDDAAIRFIPGTAGRYASLIFTFESEGWAQGGMNEHGLFFDAASTPYQEVLFDHAKKDFSGYLWQAILDKCKTVDEAIQFLADYRIPELEEAHIVIADASGEAVLIGVENGNVVVKRSDELILQTNFNPWNPQLSDEPLCSRYQKAMEIINVNNGLEEEEIVEILKNTHQDSLTVYSNVYDLKNRSVRIFSKANFEESKVVSFKDFDGSEDCTISLIQLSNGSIPNCKSENIRLYGTVVASDHKPLPFVNIGIKNTNKGTISDPDGTYRLDLSSLNVYDSVMFSSIGYSSRTISVKNLMAMDFVELEEEALVLDEVVVLDRRKYKKARMGYVRGKDGILPLDTVQGGGAVAMLLDAPKEGFYVDQIQFRLMYNSKDTLRFRLHFFEFDESCQCPGEELLGKEVILKEYDKRFGWVRLDLFEENIYLNRKRIFVGFEWLETRDQRDRMLEGLRDWERWKKEEYERGNDKIELVNSTHPNGDTWNYLKYHGNMMNWPGWNSLPPFTGLMVETGKRDETKMFKTFERKTSFSKWIEKDLTLNAVLVISY